LLIILAGGKFNVLCHLLGGMSQENVLRIIIVCILQLIGLIWPRWIFGCQMPGLLLCLLMACFTLPKDLGLAEGVKRKTLWEAMKVFDFKGSLLLTSTITSLILGLVSAQSFRSSIFPTKSFTESWWQRISMVSSNRHNRFDICPYRRPIVHLR
jgi:hypothetical protein